MQRMVDREAEYRVDVVRLEAERHRLAEYWTRLKETGLSDEEVKRVTDPLMSFHLQLSDEIESYERPSS